MSWSGRKNEENCDDLVKEFHGNCPSKTVSCRKIKSVFRDVKWCFHASRGLKGLSNKIVIWHQLYIIWQHSINCSIICMCAIPLLEYHADRISQSHCTLQITSTYHRRRLSSGRESGYSLLNQYLIPIKHKTYVWHLYNVVQHVQTSAKLVQNCCWVNYQRADVYT